MTLEVALEEAIVTERLLSDRYRFSPARAPSHLSSAQQEARQQFLDELDAPRRYRPVERCPYCGGQRFLKIAEVDARGVPAQAMLCEACDGCFKGAVLDAEANAYYYRHLSYALRGKGLSEEAMERLFNERVRSVAIPRYRFIRRHVGLRPDRDLIIELGCNDGANLAPWRAAGFEVLGIDLDPRVVEFGRRKELRLVCADFLDEAALGARRPGLIILSHLLEHATDAHAVLERVRTLIEPSGYAFIEVPGIRVGGIGNLLQYLDVEHNYHFELKSLSRLLNAHGLHRLYADEFIRALVAVRPAVDGTPSAAWTVPPRSQRMAASMLGSCVRVLQGLPRPLYEWLQAGESRTLRTRLLARTWNAYFRCHYAS